MRGRSRHRGRRCRRHRLTQSVVTALGPRSPPAPPSRRVRAHARCPARCRLRPARDGRQPPGAAARGRPGSSTRPRCRPPAADSRRPSAAPRSQRPAAGSIRPLECPPAGRSGSPRPGPAQPRTALSASPGVGVAHHRPVRGRSTLPTALAARPSSAPRCAAAGVSRPVRRPVEPLISRPAAPLRDPRPPPRHPRSVPGPPLARGDP